MAIDPTIRERIHEFVVSNFLFDSGEVSDEASLMGDGIVDSTGVLELVMFVEESFDIVVADEEVLPEYFDTITALATYVERKTSESLHVLAS